MENSSFFSLHISHLLKMKVFYFLILSCGVSFFSFQSVFAGIIPCTLKEEFMGAPMQCVAKAKTYCAWWVSPTCTTYTTTHHSHLEPAWCVWTGCTTVADPDSCDPNTPINDKPYGDPVEQTLYSYVPTGDAAVSAPPPIDPGYVPVNKNRPLKWATAYQYDAILYNFTFPSVIQNNISYPSCSGGDCGTPRSTNWCVVSHDGVNAQGCYVSRVKRQMNIPADQNSGILEILTIGNTPGEMRFQTYGPISPTGVVGGPAPMPENVRANQAEGVFGLADDGAPRITIEGIDTGSMFVMNTTTWCNIDTYSKSQANNYTQSPGCRSYAFQWGNLINAEYGDDLFKNLSIKFEDTSGISSLSIQLGKCSYNVPADPAYNNSCSNGWSASVKTKILSYDDIKQRLGVSSRIDTECLVPGKNAFFITAADDARSDDDGIQFAPESASLSVPGYIWIDNTPSKIQLTGDFADALYDGRVGNTFTGCFLNATGTIDKLKNNGRWVNYSVFGNIKIGDTYSSWTTDNCKMCYFSGALNTCNSTAVRKPTWPGNHSIWVSPLWVDQQTGKYAGAVCGWVAIPAGSCTWGCEDGYTRYTKTSGIDACGLSATCGSASHTETSETPSWNKLCLQGNPTGIMRSGSGWTWGCESRDSSTKLINSVSCLAYFPGQATCVSPNCQQPSWTPSCQISFQKKFGGENIGTELWVDIWTPATLSWDTKNMGNFKYSCSGIQVPGRFGNWEWIMQAWAGTITNVILRGNVACSFKDLSDHEICSYTNSNINPPADYWVCWSFADGSIFQDIPKPPTGTTAPNDYCQFGDIVDFTNLAKLSTTTFTDTSMSGAAHAAYKTLIDAGTELTNGPFIWGCKKNLLIPCAAWACTNGMTYDQTTHLCDGACAEGTITVITDGQKQCLSCAPYEGYEQHMNNYAPGKFACYYYSSELKFPYMGLSNDDPTNLTGSYWHGESGSLWKDYKTLMDTLWSFEKPGDLIDWQDIHENASGSAWTAIKYGDRHDFIAGSGAHIGAGTTGYDITAVDTKQAITPNGTYSGTTFPKPCFAGSRAVDPGDVWVIKSSTKWASCGAVSDASITNPPGWDIDNLLHSAGWGYTSNCELEADYTGAWLSTMTIETVLQSVAKPNSTGVPITYTKLEQDMIFGGGLTGGWGVHKVTETYVVGSEIMKKVNASRNCGSIGGCWKPTNDGSSSLVDQENFSNKYIDVAPDGATCWEEQPTVDFTVERTPWCAVAGKSMSACYKVTGYDAYGQEIHDNFTVNLGISPGDGPILYQAVYPYYWDEFYDTDIPTEFMDGHQPFLYDGNLACWLVFENTYRTDHIGMMHFKPAWAHNNMMHPYVYVSQNMDKTFLNPKIFRKPSSDLPDGITFGLAENGTCSVIAQGMGWANAPTRKKPRIIIMNPPVCTGASCTPSPPDMCTVWSDSAWAYVQQPCQ